MITIEQCRAARGLLNWTQQDLAKATSLSKTAINNFEKGNSSGKVETLQAIINAFETAGIELLPNHGLRKREVQPIIFHGKEAHTALFNDITATLTTPNDELLIYNMREGNPLQSRLTQHLQKAKAPHNTPIKLRILHGKTHTPLFIYGDKVAMQIAQGAMITVIKSAEASQAERNYFEMLWQNATSHNTDIQHIKHIKDV